MLIRPNPRIALVIAAVSLALVAGGAYLLAGS